MTVSSRLEPVEPEKPREAAWISPQEEVQGLPRYLDTIWAGKWIILLCFVACVGAAAVYLVRADKVYEASADLLVNPQPDLPVPIPGVITQSNDPSRVVETVTRLVDAPSVAARVKRRLELKASVESLRGDVEVSPVAQSDIVTITASAASATQAAALANAFGEEFVTERTERLHQTLDDFIERLRPQVEGIPRAEFDPESPAAQLRFLRTMREGPDPSVRLESRAEPPSSPSSPRPLLTAGAAILGGLVLGLIGAFALQLLDPRLRREEQLRSAYRLPILARIPIERGRRKRPLLPSELSLAALDGFQALRAALTVTRRDSVSGRAVLVTGASPGDGKTTTSINLASTIAAAGKRVILVEADSRRPSIGAALGLRAEIGLASVIQGRSYLVDALIPVGDAESNLRVLLTSPDEAPAADVLSNLSVDTLLLQAQRLADWVIVDSPPLNHVAETTAIARSVDDVLIVSRIGATNTRDLVELSEMLAQQDITPAGFVVIGGHARTGYY